MGGEMKKLGEQWVEEIDGKRHMLKAVEGESCKGCTFGMMHKGYGLNDIHVCDRDDDCPLEYANTVVKDLGILNEDGCLPSSWGGYPEVIRVGKPNFVTYFKVSLVVKYGDGSGIQIHVTGKTKQQAIDAWNRRV